MTHVLLAAGSGTNLDPLFSKGLFWILAVLSVGAAITMIFMRQAVHCALMLAIGLWLAVKDPVRYRFIRNVLLFSATIGL